MKLESLTFWDWLPSRSREGAWIEIKALAIKFLVVVIVAPARERGLKYSNLLIGWCPDCRSREGAWIEILQLPHMQAIRYVAPARERGLKSLVIGGNMVTNNVAPARERGLKCFQQLGHQHPSRRSREGAWIEILPPIPHTV